MEYRPLDLTIISAKDLNDVNLFSKMDVYAVVSLSSDPRSKQKTQVDKDGGKNPTWNFPMKFNVEESAAQQNRHVLHIQIRADRNLGDRDIGEVHVPIKELLDTANDAKTAQFVSYQVRKPNGKPKGVLNFSFKFGEKVAAPATGVKNADEPVTAYPAAVPGPSVPYPLPGSNAPYPPPGSNAPYPPPGGPYPPAGYQPYGAPPMAAHGYGGPPAGYPAGKSYGYGYPPPSQPGYAYPPQQQPPKKNKFGMGLGAGLLGGALGGLLIGDMISDATDGYDGGFDGGFDF